MTEQRPSTPKNECPWRLGLTSLPTIIVFAWMSGAGVTSGFFWLMSGMKNKALGWLYIALGAMWALHVILGYRNVRRQYRSEQAGGQ